MLIDTSITSSAYLHSFIDLIKRIIHEKFKDIFMPGNVWFDIDAVFDYYDNTYRFIGILKQQEKVFIIGECNIQQCDVINAICQKIDVNILNIFSEMIEKLISKTPELNHALILENTNVQANR